MSELESVELFDEQYFPIRSEQEFEQLMEQLKWRKVLDYGKSDYPTHYPCLVRVGYEVNPNGRDYPNVYAYYQEDVEKYHDRLQEMI
jgi:hypothetical protein